MSAGLLPAGTDGKQRLAILHRLAIFDQTRIDFPGHVRLDLVHQLHRFDDAENLPGVTWSPARTKGGASGQGEP